MKNNSQFNLRFDDGTALQAPIDISNFSTLLAEFQHDHALTETIQISVSNSEIFKLFLKYCNMHNYQPPNYKIPEPLPTGDLSKVLCPTDHKFLTEPDNNIDDGKVADLLNLANYLQSTHLYNVCCCYIASIFRFQTWEEIRQRFDIQENLTLELDEKLKKQYYMRFCQSKNMGSGGGEPVVVNNNINNNNNYGNEEQNQQLLQTTVQQDQQTKSNSQNDNYIKQETTALGNENNNDQSNQMIDN